MRCGFLTFSILTIALPGYTAAQQPAKQIENTLGMKLTLVPAGEFMMGAEEDPSDTLAAFPYARREWLDGETPQHRVKITKPFYMGTHEVTLGQFLQFYHAAKYKMDCETDGKPSWGYSADGQLIESNLFRPWNTLAWKAEMNHPAVYISWNDATAFCKWLIEKEKKNYRLPTEADGSMVAELGLRHDFLTETIPKIWYASETYRIKIVELVSKIRRLQFSTQARKRILRFLIHS